jgi:hypothetical protein
MNLIVRFSETPREDIGPFTITIMSTPSSGLSLDTNKVNPISIDGPSLCSGIVKVSNEQPTITTYITGVTYNQLTEGYEITDIDCYSDILTIKSDCNSIDETDLFGLNGYPYLELTLDNIFDSNAIITSTITVTPNDIYTPVSVPETLTLTQTGIGYKIGKIVLFQGTYTFSFNITNISGSTSNEYKTATLTYQQCDDLYITPVPTPTPTPTPTTEYKYYFELRNFDGNLGGGTMTLNSTGNNAVFTTNYNLLINTTGYNLSGIQITADSGYKITKIESFTYGGTSTIISTPNSTSYTFPTRYLNSIGLSDGQFPSIIVSFELI